MKRQQIAAGNWKMNTTVKEGVKLASAIAKKTKKEDVVSTSVWRLLSNF